MKKHLKFISTVGMSESDWLAYRKNGLGASETGTVLGLDPYKSAIQLFYEKCGEDLGYNVENIAMFMGSEQESFVAKLWQYWEGSEASMIANYRAGKIVRRCQRVNAYVTNPDFPWLFVSLDRKINRTDTAPEGALEIKTIAGYEADKWEHGIPPKHVIQVQTQLLVCEFPHGELATLRDGRQFDVLPFDHYANIADNIIRITRDFWERVTEARKILTMQYEANRNFNYREFERLGAELQQLEPEPDGSAAFADYLKAKYRIAEPGVLSGAEEQLEWAKLHQQQTAAIKELKTDRDLYENRLKHAMKDATKLDFGPSGFVSWKADTNGTRRFFNNVDI